MLLNLAPEELGGAVVNARKVLGGYALAAVGILLVVRLSTIWWSAPADVSEDFGSIEQVGEELFRTYLLPFEMVSILLLGAIIGASSS